MTLSWDEHYAKYRTTYIKKSRRYYNQNREIILEQKRKQYAELTSAERAVKREKKRAYAERNKDKLREAQRAWLQTPEGKASRAACRAREREKVRREPWRDRERHLRHVYGLTLEEFNVRLAAQDNKCLLCGSAKERFVVDHDHETGKIRGILCWSCNTGIGHVERFARLNLNTKLTEYLGGA